MFYKFEDEYGQYDKIVYLKTNDNKIKYDDWYIFLVNGKVESIELCDSDELSEYLATLEEDEQKNYKKITTANVRLRYCENTVKYQKNLNRKERMKKLKRINKV